MTRRGGSGGERPRPAAVASDRYRVLQTGYREALLTQLDLVITELQDEGDFTDEQIVMAVKIRLGGGREALRHHKLAEQWSQGSRAPGDSERR